MGATAEAARSSPGRRLVRAAVLGAGLFCSIELAAGPLEAPRVRLHAAVWALVAVVTALGVDRPDLEAELRRRPEGAVEPTFHFYLMAGLVAWNLLAPAFDARWALAPLEVGRGLALAAAACVAAGGALSVWAVRANPFYSLYVQNQAELGHAAVCTGPYRLVRHPAYAGMLAANLATPLVGGSLLGLAGAVPYAAILLVRTAREDGWARGELAGYAHYAERVRWRLVPLVW